MAEKQRLDLSKDEAKALCDALLTTLQPKVSLEDWIEEFYPRPSTVCEVAHELRALIRAKKPEMFVVFAYGLRKLAGEKVRDQRDPMATTLLYHLLQFPFTGRGRTRTVASPEYYTQPVLIGWFASKLDLIGDRPAARAWIDATAKALFELL